MPVRMNRGSRCHLYRRSGDNTCVLSGYHVADHGCSNAGLKDRGLGVVLVDVVRAKGADGRVMTEMGYWISVEPRDIFRFFKT